MKVGILGLGQAGGMIADLLAYHSLWGRHRDTVSFALAINSAQSDLLKLKIIQMKDRLLIGQTVVKGHGAGLNRELGKEIAKNGMHTVMSAVTEKLSKNVDAFILIAGLGGGTGSGAAPLIAARLREAYDDPVFLIGVVPGQSEGQLQIGNAIQCMRETEEVVNGTILFDNDVWKNEGMPLKQSYSTMNDELVRPLPMMLGAGETADEKVGIKVIDVPDIMNAWEGYSYIGYSESKAKKVGDRLRFFRKKTSLDELSPATRCFTVVRNAATMRLSGECDMKKARKALMIIGGPPDQLNMEGFSRARTWLESSIAMPRVWGGDYPVPGWDSVAAVVMLCGYTEVPALGYKASQALIDRVCARYPV